MGGDLAERTRSHWPLDPPLSRSPACPAATSPTSARSTIPTSSTCIDSLGYDGWIGCEYRPRGKTLDGLGWAKRYGIGAERVRNICCHRVIALPPRHRVLDRPSGLLR